MPAEKTKKVSPLEGAVDRLSQSLLDMDKAMDVRIVELEKKLVVADARITALESTMETMNVHVSALNAAVATGTVAKLGVKTKLAAGTSGLIVVIYAILEILSKVQQ